MILHGGRVHTVDDVATDRAKPLPSRAAGSSPSAPTPTSLGLAGPRTRRIDLRGRTLLPGFQDAHVHTITSALDRLRCDLTVSDDAATYLELIRAYAAAHPERPAILGGGWSMAAFPGGTPDRALLDAIVPDRPVALDNRDGHGTWVNSKALELAGIDDDIAGTGSRTHRATSRRVAPGHPPRGRLRPRLGRSAEA